MAEMRYYAGMRPPASIRAILLAVLLAAANVVFANHVFVHTSAAANNCEWCVCQGQTPALPSPGADPVVLQPVVGSVQKLAENNFISAPVSPYYRSRAPPFSSR